MGMTTAADTKTYTETEATDEALLLITRKMRRMYPEAFAAVWAKLPDGAKDALLLSEVRADSLRDKQTGKTWAVVTENE